MPAGPRLRDERDDAREVLPGHGRLGGDALAGVPGADRLSPWGGGSFLAWGFERQSPPRDAWLDAGFNFIDTADIYSRWVPGHEGGESERVIGRWLKRRGRRDDVVIATKLGHQHWDEARRGLRPERIRAAVEDSLQRLQTDHIDILYLHRDFPGMDFDEALQALEQSEPRLAQVVEMRYFGGLTDAEIGAALGVTDRTVRRDWEQARLFLAEALK